MFLINHIYDPEKGDPSCSWSVEIKLSADQYFCFFNFENSFWYTNMNMTGGGKYGDKFMGKLLIKWSWLGMMYI